MKHRSGEALFALVVAIVVSLAAPVWVQAAEGTLRVDGCAAVDTAVVVRVANTGSTTESGVLAVTAIVDGVPVVAAQTVTVAAHRAAYVSMDFGSDVDLVLTVRFTDAGDPV